MDDGRPRPSPSEAYGSTLYIVDHPHVHVFFDVAVIQPGARVVRDHVHSLHLRRPEQQHIGAPAVVNHHVAVPVRRVEVDAFSHGQQIPAHALALLHGHHRSIGKNVAVDSALEVGGGKPGAGR